MKKRLLLLFHPVRTRLFILSAFLLIYTGVQAQITAEQIADISFVAQVEMNYEGTHIAFVTVKPRSADEAIGGDYRELRILELESGEVTEIITAPQSAFAPAWITGTDRLAFRMTNQDYHDRPQVYSVNTEGEDLQKHTSAPEGVMAFAFSSDPTFIAYTMRSPWPDEVQQRRDKGFDMEVAGEDERRVRLWVQEVDEVRAVSPEDMSVWDFEWSPDRHHIAVRMTYGTGLDDELMFSEILKINITDNSMDLLAESQGKVGAMRWSPDGNRFAFLAAKAINDPLPQRIYVTEVGNYTSRDITPENYEGTPEWLDWKDNNTIYFGALEGTRTALREISASGGEARKLAGGDLEIFRSMSFDGSHQRFAAAVNRRDHPSEAYIGELPDVNWIRLTNHNTFLDDLKLGEQETISWEGPDGLRIEGVITYPIGYQQSNQAYPLAILPHGGPEGTSIDGWNTRPLYPAQLYASRGYVVLKPNYRGSGGRGSAFTMANHRDLGGKEFEDVIRGIDNLAFGGVVDPGKVGMSGTSYGGYFSAWAGTRYSDRFAAAITFAGLSNWISFMGTTDIPHEMSITHWDLWWFENEGLNWDRSPVAHLQQANTPIMVAHGLADERVHPEQSIQLHQFLKLNDIPTELVMYPRQPHGLTERAHRVDFMERSLRWFDEHVK